MFRYQNSLHILIPLNITFEGTFVRGFEGNTLFGIAASTHTAEYDIYDDILLIWYSIPSKTYIQYNNKSTS